jgi:hypothetical protein
VSLISLQSPTAILVRGNRRGRVATYLVPLTDVFLLTLLEELLVVRNAIFAVDEAAEFAISCGSEGGVV